MAKDYNLEELEIKIMNLKQAFFEMTWNSSISFDTLMRDKFVDISYKIDRMRPSFLAPAYHYNNYCMHLERDKVKMNSVSKLCYQIESQSTFVSIKIGLDRLVQILRYFYKGVSPNTTFGRYRDNGKARGFMQTVCQGKDEDKLLNYIEKEYHKWIKNAVSPRDMITHYKDLGLLYVTEISQENPFENKFDFRPVHITKDRKEGISNDTPLEEVGVTHFELKIMVDNWYSFFDKILRELIKRSHTNKNA